MIYKKFIRRIEKRLKYLIDEALSIPVTDISWVLFVISDEFATKTGINLDSWINGQYSITYSSTKQDYNAVNAIIREKKPINNIWSGPEETILYKTFGSSPFGSFSILIQCSEQELIKKRKVISNLAIRIFSKLMLWFNNRELEYKHNYFELPDPYYFNYNSLDYNFYYYRGAAYLRLENSDELYEYASWSLKNKYYNWMSFFEVSDFYSLAFDAGCLVVLLRKHDSSLPYFNACALINQIEDSTSSEPEKPIWAICYYDELPITMKLLGELRLKVLSGISGYKHYLSFGGDEEIDYGRQKELPEVPSEDYWDKQENEIWENSRKLNEPVIEKKNPFEDFFNP
ncbi:MAG: hypothetical protein K6G24_10460 [Lachnospiraceae bacterium]|nr:hypothetical protein [Lachnospiraceae bacterium]